MGDLIIKRKKDTEKGKNQLVIINLTKNEYNLYELDNRSQDGRRLLETLEWDDNIKSIKSYIRSEIEILEEKAMQHKKTIALSETYNNTNGLESLKRIIKFQADKLEKLKNYEL